MEEASASMAAMTDAQTLAVAKVCGWEVAAGDGMGMGLGFGASSVPAAVVPSWQCFVLEGARVA